MATYPSYKYLKSLFKKIPWKITAPCAGVLVPPVNIKNSCLVGLQWAYSKWLGFFNLFSLFEAGVWIKIDLRQQIPLSHCVTIHLSAIIEIKFQSLQFVNQQFWEASLVFPCGSNLPPARKMMLFFGSMEDSGVVL